jgi:hydrogenase maturation protein HypF
LVHSTLASCIVGVAREVGLEQVVLSGGCFQNRILTERTIEGLKKGGFRVYWHQRVPPNDGGIALGQLYAAVMKKRTDKPFFQETNAQWGGNA